MTKHWHVWRISSSGRGAFMRPRGYVNQNTAHSAARRAEPNPAFRFVMLCGQEDFCPHPPAEQATAPWLPKNDKVAQRGRPNTENYHQMTERTA